MPEKPSTAGPHPAESVPQWMRKSTIWLILALTSAVFALVAYYLLPLWWARVVNLWVGASNSWVTGILLGFVLVLVTLGSVRAAWHLNGKMKTNESTLLAGMRLVLAGIAGISLVMTLLTVFIALGLTDPLKQARELWQNSAPNLLAATLVGGLLAIIALLGWHTIRVRFFPKPIGEDAPSPEEFNDEDTPTG